MNKVSSHLLLAALVCCGSGFAQQEKGDKEVGVGGQLLFTHTSNFIGNADFQLSFGYYASVRNYFGFEADPNITFEHTPGTPAVQGVALVNGKLVPCNAGSAGCIGAEAATSGTNSTNVGGFYGANYRRLVGNPKGRVFPFIGGGGGAYVQAGTSGKSVLGSFFGEAGLKAYVSQKTSLEFAYKLLYYPQSGGSFQDNSASLLTISLRHIF
jgi:hypothetical protein